MTILANDNMSIAPIVTLAHRRIKHKSCTQVVGEFVEFVLEVNCNLSIIPYFVFTRKIAVVERLLYHSDYDINYLLFIYHLPFLLKVYCLH